MPDAYDFIAIGAGPAGESAAELASFFGHRSAVIEKARPGGTVTTTGGVPTKTLREAALYFSGLCDGDVYGLRSTARPEIVTDVIRKRTLGVCRLLQEVTAQNIAQSNVDYIQGNARLDHDGSVVVTPPEGQDRKLRAQAVLIATGSRPFRPKNISFDIPGVCDTDTILHRGRVPRDIVIIGGGPVGVEFVTICHALGANVTMVDRGSRLLSTMDAEISDRMTALLTEWGVAIVFGATAEHIDAKHDALEVRLSSGEVLTPDTVLFAAGRIANTEELGLDIAGIDCDARGRIIVDEAFRTSAKGIYAAGDVLGPTLASIAMEQARAAVCDAFGIRFEGVVDPAPVSAVYGMPEVSGAGLTEEHCREKNLNYGVGYADLTRTPRGAIAGRGGLLKLIFLKADRKLIGVHCIGDIASELVGIGQMAIRCGATMNTIMNMSMNTPTYAYAYKYAAFDGLSRAMTSEKESRPSTTTSKRRRGAPAH
jgi:NAD(P) transhydrogenase